MTTVLCVPQWQGSGHRQASQLIEGARRTAELLPAETRMTIPLLDEGSEIKDGVRSHDVLAEHLRRIQEAVTGIDDLVVTAGGDCGVDVAPVAAAHARYGDQLTVLWLDAHPDMYTPLTIRSFHGMVVRTLLGDGPAPFVPDRLLSPAQVILGGVRTGDPTEFAFIEEVGVRRYGVADLEQAFDGLTGPVYVHVDLDVLDPAAFGSVCYPEPDGVAPDRLVALLSSVDNLVGAAITEHAPAPGADNPEEADIIRALGTALCR